MAKKSCPRGQANCPQVESAQRFCSKCGHIYVLQTGDTVRDYQVIDSYSLLDRTFYLTQNGQGEHKVLVEVLDVFQPEQRAALSQFITVQAQRLRLIIEAAFTEVVEHLPLLYSVYPADVWEMRTQSVSNTIRQSGLLSFEQMRQVYDALLKYWQVFSEVHIANPGITLSGLFWGNHGDLHLLDWEFSVTGNDFIQYPRFYTGYHQPVLYDAERLKNYNIKITMAGIYSSFIELIIGINPVFWTPEMANLIPFRSMLNAGLFKQIQKYQSTLHPRDLPQTLPAPLINSALGKRLQQANLLFYQGYTAYQQQHWSEAVTYFQKSVDTQTTVFSLLWLGLATAETGKLIEAIAHLERADQNSPLAQIAYHKSKLLHRLGQHKKAIETIHTAIERFPIYAEAHYQLGLFYQKETNHFDQAEASFKRALDIHNTPIYRQALRDLYLAEGLEQEAQTLPVNLYAPVKVKATFEDTYGGPMVSCPEGHSYPLGPNVNCPDCKRSLLWSPGQRIQTYTVTEIIRPKDYERGKRETLYKGHNDRGESVTIKQYDLSSNLAYDAFYREKQILEALEHPVIPTLINAFIHESCYGVLIYPYYEGVTLQQLIEERPGLSETQIYQFLRALAATLVFLQSCQPSIIHGDIKPANILIGSEGEIRLLDWSSAQLLNEPGQKMSFPTTNPYAAPEYALTYQVYPSFDFYALGVTLIHAATGMQPHLFIDYTAQALVGWQEYALHISAPTRQWIASLVTWTPESRSQWDLPSLLQWLKEHHPQAGLQPLTEQQQLTQHMHSLTKTEDKAQGNQLINAILECRSNYQTFYFCAFHAQRLQLSQRFYALLQRCRQSKPSFIQAHWLLAQAHLDKGNITAALTVLNDSLEYCSNRPETYQLMTTAYYHQSQPGLMYAALQKAIRYAPDWVELRLELAQYYVQILNYQEARHIIKSILDSGPKSQIKGRAAHIMGAIEVINGHIASADHYFHTALSLRPEDPLIHYDLGLLYRRTGHLDKALQHFQKCLEQMPEHPIAEEHLNWCQEKLSLAPAQASLTRQA
jgi:serine/threonine protein kinase/TolA-binding protein